MNRWILAVLRWAGFILVKKRRDVALGWSRRRVGGTLGGTDGWGNPRWEKYGFLEWDKKGGDLD